MEKPEICEITEIIQETPNIKTYVLDKKTESEIGQYLMVWLPGIDEIPISPSKMNPTHLTVQKVGPATKEMFKMNQGDKIGLRGPYGNTFEIKGEKILLVSGGCGGAPILPLAKELAKKQKNVTTALGGRTKEELLFHDEFKKIGKTIIATEDGSKGHEGYITETITDKLDRYDTIYSCGPEPMLQKIYKNTPPQTNLQVSLQRYVKCGVGICGSCSMDPDGKRLCKEGPIFNKKQLKNTEFGEYRRDASGKKIQF